MATLLHVSRRTAEAADQKLPQPPLGPRQVIGWIHRAQNVVAGNLPVKGRDQALEAVFADHRINVILLQAKLG